MRVIIAGSRSITSYLEVEKAMDHFLTKYPDRYATAIICGMAKGADLLGKEWAVRRKIRVIERPADWDNLDAPGAIIVDHWTGRQYNSKAGHDRNQVMVDEADAAVFIRKEGKSSGTDDCIRRAQKKGIPVYIHRV